MRASVFRKRVLIVLAVVVPVALSLVSGAFAKKQVSSANVSVFSTGLNNPRGLTWGPDGNLYVAEGGFGGPLQTNNPLLCTQVPAPVGPYSGGFTASISKIGPGGGAHTIVAPNLPSSTTSLPPGLTSGVADVKFIGNRLYALTAGAGCSHGLAGTDNTVLRVNSNGSTTQVADLSAFQKAHPVANPEPDDFEPDGTWFSMVAVRGDLYAVEPNHGEVDRINPNSGAISRVVDVSASQHHIVPTSIAYQGNFFLGNLGTFPVVPGSETIFKLNPAGNLKPWVSGLSTVLGLALDPQGRLYALESMTAPGFPGAQDAGTGMIVRIDHSGAVQTIATGFTFPTAMTFGPDGNLYVSNMGFGPPIPGLGEIDKVTVPR
jgi:hypothetical protein